MSLILKALASDDGKLVFVNQIDLQKYCKEMRNRELVVEIKEFSHNGVKQNMYAYYHAVVLDSAVRGYRDTGDVCDKVEADFRLRARFAKTFRKSEEGEHIVVLEDKKDMSKERLSQFINDCIIWIEANLSCKVPDSESYLMEKKHGKKLTSVKGKRNKNNFEQI